MSQKISGIWDRLRHLQIEIFPSLKNSSEPLLDKHLHLIRVLEIARIEEFIVVSSQGRGRPKSERLPIVRAFLAKGIFNLTTTRELMDRLEIDPMLRRICGWERRNQIPKEWTFSRAFSEIAKTDLLDRIHRALVALYEGGRLVGHVSRDSTAIEAREKPVKKVAVEPKPKRKRGRPRKGETRPPAEPTRLEKQREMSLEQMLNDLPTECDRGTKKNSQGYKVSWNGYKLHMDVGDGQIPISCILTSASLHDSQVALPLASMTHEQVTNCYDLMDAAYDAEIIKKFSEDLGHVPIIDSNPRCREKIPFDPAKEVRYRQRSSVERVFGRLKDEYGGRMIRVRGAVKVMAHLLFGIIPLTVDQLSRFIE